jgi:hypothetical protein
MNRGKTTSGEPDVEPFFHEVINPAILRVIADTKDSSSITLGSLLLELKAACQKVEKAKPGSMATFIRATSENLAKMEVRSNSSMPSPLLAPATGGHGAFPASPAKQPPPLPLLNAASHPATGGSAPSVPPLPKQTSTTSTTSGAKVAALPGPSQPLPGPKVAAKVGASSTPLPGPAKTGSTAVLTAGIVPGKVAAMAKAAAAAAATPSTTTPAKTSTTATSGSGVAAKVSSPPVVSSMAARPPSTSTSTSTTSTTAAGSTTTTAGSGPTAENGAGGPRGSKPPEGRVAGAKAFFQQRTSS